MALLSRKQSSGCSTGCMIGKWIVALLLLLTSVAALVGVYQSHVISIGADVSRLALQFGSTSGSLSIIAFTISVMAWYKKMVCCLSKSCDVCSK